MAFDVARGLEGHDDNVAASLAGGVVVTAAGRVVGVPVAVEPAVVLWVPGQETVTAESRARLADPVPRDDAVFNLGRTALLVAALATGRVEALRDACADRLHQEARLRAVPGADEAIRAALEAGAWSAWLSGSGPSVAAFVEPGREDEVVAALPEGGVPRVTTVDPRGAVVDPTPGPGDGGEERLRDAR
ncbi:MAG: hypothetical protein M5U14_07660 [Acidimicrobiia bacterium]|nr:hypothetical protein [Acidimicrobiia bacterium]